MTNTTELKKFTGLIDDGKQHCEDLDASRAEMVWAKAILTEAWETNFMHGRTRADTIAAAIYTSFRVIGDSRPPGVVAESVGVEKQSLKDTHQSVIEELSIQAPTTSSVEYIPWICHAHNLPNHISQNSCRLLDDANYVSGNPVGVAAAAVYLACENSDYEGVTLKELAETVHLTKETVWRHKSTLENETET